MFGICGDGVDEIDVWDISERQLFLNIMELQDFQVSAKREQK